MIRFSWLPWKFLVRRLARTHGFLDPVAVFAQLSRFGKPSEVIAPTELIRVGAVMHARGLINAQAIQHNLDWVWPYWVSRQFSPRDDSFVPRAFSLTHINLTHRNWTAAGLPDIADLPIVDPAGLVMPFYDSWSVDAWIIPEPGASAARSRALVPSRIAATSQSLDLAEGLMVVTESREQGRALTGRVDVLYEKPEPLCRLRYEALSDDSAWLAVSVRPCNPEGISFVHEILPLSDTPGWMINGSDKLFFESAPDRISYSNYHSGDVFGRLPDGNAADDEAGIRCPIGMATSAALYRVDRESVRNVTITIPLAEARERRELGENPRLPPIEATRWSDLLADHCRMECPDARIKFLYDAAIRSIVIHSPGEVYPGPFTYKRFWFRDATFIIHALLCAGFPDRAARALDDFPRRQHSSGYFCSQSGEWDSNGQVLWIMRRFREFSGQPSNPQWKGAISRAAIWIARKRLPKSGGTHDGLLPAGFSAEHLGPNDIYYWDDFWSIAGLIEAARFMSDFGDSGKEREFMAEADDLSRSTNRSLELAAERLGHPAMPAAPDRRMDAGAIGSIVVGYPLQLWNPKDPRLLASVEYLLNHHFLNGGFFQDMIHSGINPYLTLHVAQILMRADDARAGDLVRAVAALASSTGQWPEAVHPRTGGGCMGDGQHIWAAAEWIMLVRNMFVREEEPATLILGQGLLPDWLNEPTISRLGPAPTRFGPITVEFRRDRDEIVCRWDAVWHGAAPAIQIRLPGANPYLAQHGETAARIPMKTHAT